MHLFSIDILVRMSQIDILVRMSQTVIAYDVAKYVADACYEIK